MKIPYVNIEKQYKSEKKQLLTNLKVEMMNY